MFYPARRKKITVDQSKVLKNRQFRFFWATRYTYLSDLPYDLFTWLDGNTWCKQRFAGCSVFFLEVNLLWNYEHWWLFIARSFRFLCKQNWCLHHTTDFLFSSIASFFFLFFFFWGGGGQDRQMYRQKQIMYMLLICYLLLIYSETYIFLGLKILVTWCACVCVCMCVCVCLFYHKMAFPSRQSVNIMLYISTMTWLMAMSMTNTIDSYKFVRPTEWNIKNVTISKFSCTESPYCRYMKSHYEQVVRWSMPCDTLSTESYVDCPHLVHWNLYVWKLWTV